jgi:hypothetical protein
MALLRDIRLVLIIGLAIICLLALRLCSSEYQPVAVAPVDTGGSVAEQETQAETDTSEPAGEVDAQAEENAAQESGVVAAEQSSVEESTMAEAAESEQSQPEQSASAEQATDKDTESATDSSDAQASGDVDTVASAQSAGQEQIEPVDIVPSAIDETAATPLKRIVIQAPASSGEFIPDLKTDIDSVQDGMTQYNEKLELIDNIINRVRNPG